MSHHNSGPRAHALPAGDITDMYVFPAPDHPGRLVLVLDVVPFADPQGTFAPELIYRFRARPVTADPDAPARFVAAGPDSEVVVDCTFAAPQGAEQAGTCTVSSGPSVTFTVGDEAGGASDQLRVFAGPRWDPFFDDAMALVTTLTTGKMAFTPSGTILGDGKNVLSIVVQIDTALLGDVTLVGVVGETLIGGAIPVRWERFGRPEFANAILGPKNHDPVNRDLEIRDLFNAEDVFALGPDYVSAYRARVNANLAFWDGLDGRTDWPPAADGTHPLTELLLTDLQVVDVTRPYAEDSFLEIERAAVEGRAHKTCGGRSPNDACMPTLYTFLISADSGPRIVDGVDSATRPATRSFPYLVSPNPTPPAHAAH
ncbi:DUF4331 domain-containing protein [Nakamurella flava]|uniref:DUF4331 domain-containing protein n=1 Tax=Nakamurella flava TaxID=2576308 RepID=A0A4U6Q964_9ACTN|nr:DUF4331 family protein [Nakamurella flava]TKV56430.1 DUF4331 domain-containing protein [Nakamurella flava]